MILTKQELAEFRIAAKPLIKWLNNDSFHPHVKVIVDLGSAVLTEDVSRIINEEFIKD